MLQEKWIKHLPLSGLHCLVWIRIYVYPYSTHLGGIGKSTYEASSNIIHHCRVTLNERERERERERESERVSPFT